ncbi:MAG: site-2 protease family protein [Polyangiaceae bacterium]|nr:site-2 protease family protein [Polyangiaceae bacterium]
MGFGQVILAILGVVVLMIVHELGHMLAARRFGMRVETFSLGFGPTIWKHKPKDSPTTYQIAVVPFLAYVKIAGMNPFEPVDPKDKGSYANASLWARIVTIAAGPIANYLLAFVLFFVGTVMGGRLAPDEASMRVEPHPDGPAAQVGILKGDRVLSINGSPIRDWDALKATMAAHPGETVDVEVERNDKILHFSPVVGSEGERKGKIWVGPVSRVMGMGETTLVCLKLPPLMIYENVRALAMAITFREKPDVGGPVRMVKEVSNAIAIGPSAALRYLGAISAGLVAINLLPIPALDGGRLMFLLYEAIARKRANEKVEAKIHAVALLMFLALFVVITVHDLIPTKDKVEGSSKGAPAKSAPALSASPPTPPPPTPTTP